MSRWKFLHVREFSFVDGVASTFPSGCNGCWGHRLGVYGMVAMEIWWLYQWCIVGTSQVNQDVEGDHQWCHCGYWSVVVTFLVICCTFRMFCLWKCNFVISTFDHNNKCCHIGTPDWGPVSTKHLFSSFFLASAIIFSVFLSLDDDVITSIVLALMSRCQMKTNRS